MDGDFILGGAALGVVALGESAAAGGGGGPPGAGAIPGGGSARRKPYGSGLIGRR